MSTFPDGLFQYGGMPVGEGMLPLLGKDAKAFFVDGYNGNDNNSGLKPTEPMLTIQAAFDKTTSGNGDVIYLISTGTSTGSVHDVAITWDHDNTHLVGLTTSGLNKRARIAPSADATSIALHSPYITLSAMSCTFANFSITQDLAEDSVASIGVTVSGERNHFYNVDILTGAHANQGDEASETLRVTGSENIFDYCYLGGDTWARGNNNAGCVVRIGAGAGSQAARNMFRNCLLTMFADDTEPVFVKSTFVTDIDRWMLFDNCTMINSGSSTLDQAISIAGSSTGRIFLKDCAVSGVTNITAADSDYVHACGNSGSTMIDSCMFKAIDIS